MYTMEEIMYMAPEFSMKTLILYIGIIVVASLLAMRKRVYHFQTRTGSIPIHMGLFDSFLFCAFFKCFLWTGTDVKGGYYANYITASSMRNVIDQTVEYGYRLLMVIAYNLFGDYIGLIFLTGILTLGFVFWVLNKHYDAINPSLAVFLFTSIFLFASFSPMRNYLAGAVSLLVFDAFLEEKPVKSLILIYFASLFHSSAIIMILMFFVMFFKKIDRKLIMLAVLVVFGILFMGRSYLEVLFSGRYSIYSVLEDAHIGMQQFIYFLPLFFLLFLGSKWTKEKSINRASFAVLSVGFFFGLMSYVIAIFGRFSIYTMPLVLFAPMLMKSMEDEEMNHFSRNKLFFVVATVAYGFLRFAVFFKDYAVMEGITPYINYFGWRF